MLHHMSPELDCSGGASLEHCGHGTISPPTHTIVQEQCSVVTSTDMQILKSYDSSAAVSAVTGRSGVLVTAPVHSQGP